MLIIRDGFNGRGQFGRDSGRLVRLPKRAPCRYRGGGNGRSDSVDA